MYISFLPWVKSKLCPLETSRYWRYSRDSTEGLDICIEWTRRLFVFASEVIRLSERRRLAFYLTVHFSKEDYPYDWQVRFITFACLRSRISFRRLMHWLSEVRSANTAVVILLLSCA